MSWTLEVTFIGRRRPLCLCAGPSLCLLSVSMLFATLLVGVPVVAQSLNDPAAVFQARLALYLDLREDARHGLAPEHLVDPREPSVTGALLAVRIQRAREEAGIGDVIPGEIAEIVRDRLHRAFDATEADLLMLDLYPDGLPPDPPYVNAHYDASVAVPPPASVLGSLPPVPGVLGYRLFGRHVALWDEEAQLVIDVIPEALPAPRVWEFLELSSVDIRAIVRHAMNSAGIDDRELVEVMAEHDEPGATAPAVGAPFDWRAGNIMPPSVLHALPALPHPLEYRFVGSELVVIDMATGRVRGVLWNVLPKRVVTRDRV
jgi:hypothetical protein